MVLDRGRCQHVEQDLVPLDGRIAMVETGTKAPGGVVIVIEADLVGGRIPPAEAHAIVATEFAAGHGIVVAVRIGGGHTAGSVRVEVTRVVDVRTRMGDRCDIAVFDPFDISGNRQLRCHLVGKADGVVFRYVEVTVLGKQVLVFLELGHVYPGRIVHSQGEAVVEELAQPADPDTGTVGPVIAFTADVFLAAGKSEILESTEAIGAEGLHADGQRGADYVVLVHDKGGAGQHLHLQQLHANRRAVGIAVEVIKVAAGAAAGVTVHAGRIARHRLVEAGIGAVADDGHADIQFAVELVDRTEAGDQEFIAAALFVRYIGYG